MKINVYVLKQFVLLWLQKSQQAALESVLISLFSLVLKKKMLLVIKNWLLKKVLIIKQQSIELINGKSQTNRDRKSN